MEVDQMNLKCYDAEFLVYIHTSPNNKKYVGITSKSPIERWGKGGSSYKDNKHFWNAIQKYGWDNFTHEVVAQHLTLKQACDLEVELIAKYDAMNPDKGYNHTTGGNWSRPDEETRKRLSRAIKQNRADNPEVVEKIRAALMGHEVSAETRRKISEANTGMKVSEKERERRRNYRHSLETLEKLRGHSPWCKGLTKDTDPRLKKLSEMMKGREVPQEWRDKVSAARKAQYQNGYSPVWITDGQIETSIQKDDPLPEGFRYGRLGKKDTYIHKGEESKKICHEDLDSYLAQGWERGRPASIKDTIRKSLQVMHWEYDGLRFDRAQDLALYLQNHGYPKIVGSTITSLSKKGFDKSPTYASLHGKVVCVHHENQIHTENQS